MNDWLYVDDGHVNELVDELSIKIVNPSRRSVESMTVDCGLLDLQICAPCTLRFD